MIHAKSPPTTPMPLVRLFDDAGIRQRLTNLLILVGAMLVAVQFRLRLPYGSTLYPNYEAQPLLLYPLLLAGGLLGFALAALLTARLQWTAGRTQFVALLLGIALSFFGVSLLLPDVSLLQLAYYVGAAIFLGLLVIAWPARSLKARPDSSVLTHLGILWQNRVLVQMWVGNNVRARYSQAVLGILWIVLLPLSQALVLSLVFSYFVRMDVGDVPYISFFLAALIPWSFVSQGAINGTSAITNHMAVISQIYFPREVLVLVKLGELIVDVTFTFVAMLIVNAIVGVWPNVHYLYLPLLLFISLSTTLGLMLFLSYLTVFVQDIPQLVFVITQLLFYLSPVIYPLWFIPPEFSGITVINPLVPLIQAYRDIIVYQVPPDVISLHYPLVVGVTLLYLGYRFFKAHERRLPDLI